VERIYAFPPAPPRPLPPPGPALLELRTDPGVLRPPG
jgi:hypothetical protein